MTIGNLAKEAGYRTALIGKWHLGWGWAIPEDQRHLFETKGHARDNLDLVVTHAHKAAWREAFSQPIKGGPVIFERHMADKQGPAVEGWRLESILPTLRDRTLDLIRQHSGNPVPILLVFSLTSPHTPLSVNEP